MFGHDDHDNHDENNKPEEETVTPSDDATKDDGWQHPGPPPADDAQDDSGEDSDEPASPENTSHSDDFFAGNDDSADSGKSNGNDLIDLKQEALSKLSPLISHLDQSPDEKFRTLMMMIQASDNQDLVREAYETALKIDDEKERAQALLDIVNEINYFTQSPGKNDD